ncbi:MAG: hypothetical protein ABII22_05470 [Candidatus Micrarchaeota archaeon]
MKKLIFVILVLILIFGCLGNTRRVIILDSGKDSNESISNETLNQTLENLTVFIGNETVLAMENESTQNISEDDTRGMINEIIKETEKNDLVEVPKIPEYVQSKKQSSIILRRDMIVRDGKDIENGEHRWITHEYLNISGKLMTKNNMNYIMNDSKVSWKISKTYSYLYRPNRQLEKWCSIDRTLESEGDKGISASSVKYTNDSFQVLFTIEALSRLNDSCNDRNYDRMITLRYYLDMPMDSTIGQILEYNFGRKLDYIEDPFGANESTIEYDPGEVKIPKERNPSWEITWNFRE